MRIAAGCGCHGLNLAGWRPGGANFLPGSFPFGERFHTSYGTCPAPNITADRVSGIGDWSDDDILGAIRDGVRRDGSRLAPIMPSASYHGMSDEDLRAIVAFLHRGPPVRNWPGAPHIKAPLPHPPPNPVVLVPPGDDLALGRYLVENVCGCGDCHSPRGPAGARRRFSGAIMETGEGRTMVPNITPHPIFGIGKWTQDDLAQFLHTGETPVHGRTGPTMYGLVQTSYRYLRPEEGQAVARYILSVPAVEG